MTFSLRQSNGRRTSTRLSSHRKRNIPHKKNKLLSEMTIEKLTSSHDCGLKAWVSRERASCVLRHIGTFWYRSDTCLCFFLWITWNRDKLCIS